MKIQREWILVVLKNKGYHIDLPPLLTALSYHSCNIHREVYSKWWWHVHLCTLSMEIYITRQRTLAHKNTQFQNLEAAGEIQCTQYYHIKLYQICTLQGTSVVMLNSELNIYTGYCTCTCHYMYCITCSFNSWILSQTKSRLLIIITEWWNWYTVYCNY